jgi:hypothetical protein
MQEIIKALKKEKCKLRHGDMSLIAKNLKEPYSNVTTAFSGKAGLELSLKVLDAAKKVQAKRKMLILKKIKAKV